MAGVKDKESKVPDRASRSGSISNSKKSTTEKGDRKEPKVEIDPELLLSAKKKKKDEKPSGASGKKPVKKASPDKDSKDSKDSRDSRDSKDSKKEEESGTKKSDARRRAERKKALAERKKALADKKKKSGTSSSARSSRSSSSRSSRSGSSSSSSSRSSRSGSGSRSSRSDSSSIPGEAEGSLLTQRYLKIPVWGWLLAALVAFGVAMVVMDLRNQDRYLMVCSKSAMEIHAGKRLPWPFGHERVGGSAFRPVRLTNGADCRPQVFASKYDAQLGLLDYLLIQVRAALSRPGVNDLREARRQSQQALELSTALRKRSTEVNGLRAELAYRQGRNGIARVEDELRTALSRFREAKKLDKKRFKDMGEWIEHLQGLLVSVSPSPRKELPRTSAPTSPADIKPEKPPKKPDAGAKKMAPQTPDAGQPEEATGTLM